MTFRIKLGKKTLGKCPMFLLLKTQTQENVRWMPNTLPTRNDPKKKTSNVRLMFFLQGTKSRRIWSLEIFPTRNGPSRHEKMSGGRSMFFSRDTKQNKSAKWSFNIKFFPQYTNCGGKH